MSREMPMGLTVAEKFVGLLIFVIGVIMVYVTYNNPPTQPAASYSSIFMAAGTVLIALGVFLIITKVE
ncbi:MAG: hypothetical protein ACE5OW_04425 [Candidatus Bathyarchaeia archaeon]